MIKINTNEKKRLKFNVRVSGVMPEDLRGSMKIIMEGIEYGFPISINDGKVTVDISPLSEITNRDFSDGETFDAQLDIIAAETYIVPWKDKVKIENPLKIEANLTEEEEIEENKKLEISVEGLDEEEIEEKKECKSKPKKEKKSKPKSKFGKSLMGK